MALSFRFTNKETGQKIIISYPVYLKPPQEMDGAVIYKSEISQYIDTHSTWITTSVETYAPDLSKRKQNTLFWGNPLGFADGELLNVATWFNLPFGKWVAANGNYVEYLNHSDSIAKFTVYRADNSVIKKMTLGITQSFAEIHGFTNVNNFWDTQAKALPKLIVSTIKDDLLGTRGTINARIYDKWDDPFRVAVITGTQAPPVDPDDPYEPADPSEPSTPEGEFPDNKGTWNDPDDPVDIPENPPFFGAGSSGFITMYSPSWYQLNQLASFMWSEKFFNQIVKLWADPMQVIMGLNILPVKIPTSQNAEIMVGNVSSGVQAPLASQQYVWVDMGSVELKPYYGSYMDYAPYTKITLVLPYIGAKELITDEVMGRVINVSYRIDVLTGACIAYVKCGQSVLYQFSGNCGENIPITSASYTEMLTAYTKLAGDTAAMAVTGGGAAGGNVISSSINAISSIKPNISHTGTLASSCGAMGILTPYIIKTKPRICLPKEQYKIEGLPSFVETDFAKCKGYTQVHSTRLQGIPATDEELEMIYAQLREGVVF